MSHRHLYSDENLTSYLITDSDLESHIDCELVMMTCLAFKLEKELIVHGISVCLLKKDGLTFGYIHKVHGHFSRNLISKVVENATEN